MLTVQRERGHYWCYGGDGTGWEIAYWCGQEWSMVAVPYAIDDSRWEYISPAALQPPPDRPTITLLVSSDPRLGGYTLDLECR